MQGAIFNFPTRSSRRWRKEEVPRSAMKRREAYPRLLLADDDANVFEHPRLAMAGASGLHPVIPEPATIAPLPPYSRLFFLPGCIALGFDPKSGGVVEVESIEGKRVHAVAAFLPPGYLRLLVPAADWSARSEPFPLWAYSAVGWMSGKMVAPLIVLDKSSRWNPKNYDDRALLPAIEAFRRIMPENRLMHHLIRCATEYHCFAAKNLFLERWEAPLPVSRRCNAACLGCLSFQSPDGCVASHERIGFTPTVSEVTEIAVHHLEAAREPIVSFGQGCEGEPLTEAALLEASIQEIRSQTSAGVINLNSNGYSPTRILGLASAGLDSLRVSLASAREGIYDAYHKPIDFSLRDVAEALRVAERAGVYTMINYLVFPGVSDQPEEMHALVELARRNRVRFIHLKNLNIDPAFYLTKLGACSWAPGIGMERLVDYLRAELPDVELGYFNRWELPERAEVREDRDAFR